MHKKVAQKVISTANSFGRHLVSLNIGELWFQRTFLIPLIWSVKLRDYRGSMNKQIVGLSVGHPVAYL